MEGGSTVHKFEDSQKSAWDVIAPIIEKDRFKDRIRQRNSFLTPRRALELDAQIAATRDMIRAMRAPVIQPILKWLNHVGKVLDEFITPSSPSRSNKLSGKFLNVTADES